MIIKDAALALLSANGAAVAAQTQSDTTCRTTEGVTRCSTTTNSSRAPLDYGKTLQQGQDLVPAYQPKTSPPPKLEASPPHSKTTPERPAKKLEPIWRGNGYLASCETDDAVVKVICVTYLEGIVDGQRGVWVGEGQVAGYCLPAGVTTGQLEAVLLRFLTNNPEKRHIPTGVLAAMAFKQTFPCGSQQP